MVPDGNTDLAKDWRAREVVIAQGKMQIFPAVISISLKSIDHLNANNNSVALGL